MAALEMGSRSRTSTASSAGLMSEHSGDTRPEADLFDGDAAPEVAEHDVAVGEAGGPQGDAMRALLASYYGLAAEAPMGTEAEIDKVEFNADVYVRRLLQREGLESLLNSDDELVQEVKRLDSDMQMLVYENYSKFISATDTIRKMKNNVNDMKAEMDSLVKNMEGIASRMGTVNSFLAGKRAKVDKLVAVRRLLKRLEFLFDLPINLTRYVQKHDYDKAVSCYSAAIGILRQHAHVPSFRAIQRESDQIINSLRDDLQKKLQDVDVSAERLALFVTLLMDLGVPKSDLQATVLKAYRARFSRQLTQQQQVEEKRMKALGEQGGPGEEGFAAFVEGGVVRMDKEFVRDLEQAVDVYRGVFLESNGSGGVKANSAYTDLLDLVKSLIGQYADILRRLFKANMAYVAQGVRAERYPDVSAAPVAALKTMLAGLRRLHMSLKDAGVLQMAIGLVQEVVQAVVFLEFRGIQLVAMKRLLAVYAVVPKTRPGEEGLDLGLVFSYREQLDRVINDVSTDIGRSLEALQGLVAVAEDGDQALAGVGGKRMLMAGGPPGLALKPYAWQFITWFADAMERLAGVTFRLTENDVIDVADVKRRVYPERFFAHASSFSPLIDSEQASGPLAVNFPAIQPSPQYVLLLAVLCREVQSQLVQRTTLVLGRFYPATASAASDVGGTNKLTTEEMNNCLQGSSVRLLAHFVEVQGAELARLCCQGLSASAAPEASVDGSQATWGRVLSTKLDVFVREIGTALGVSTAGVGLAGGRRGERTDLRGPGGMPGGGRKGVHVDIERIFKVRVQVVGPVDFAVEPILQGLLRVAFKALIESVRQATLSPQAYTQVQMDVQLVRQVLPSFVKDAGTLDNMLEEALISAGERMLESPKGLDTSAVWSVVTAEYGRLSGAASGSVGLRR